MKTLTDRSAVVTGAASGIGQATAVALARRGCAMALVDRDVAGLEHTSELCRGAGSPRVSVHEVDVSSRPQMEGLVQDVLAKHDRVHILVNNAGVAVQGTFVEQRVEDIEWIMGVNLWGVVLGCKLFLPHLLQVDEAHIVNLSSVFGIAAVPRNSTYCMTKFAVRGLTEALWEELEETRVGVTCVHPGGIRTNIVVNSRSYDDEIKKVVAGRFERHAATPAVVADAIVGAILRQKRRVLVTPEAYAIDMLRRLFPTWGNRFIAQRARRMMAPRSPR